MISLDAIADQMFSFFSIFYIYIIIEICWQHGFHWLYLAIHTYPSSLYQSAGAVEYTDYTSEEEEDPPQWVS